MHFHAENIIEYPTATPRLLRYICVLHLCSYIFFLTSVLIITSDKGCVIAYDVTTSSPGATARARGSRHK